MAERREDIGVHIVAHWQSALEDVRRFTGMVEQSFSSLPRVVQELSSQVDRATESVGRLGRSDGAAQLNRHLNQSNREAAQLHRTFDRLATTGKAVASVVAGWQAGKMVLAPKLDAMASYETKLADLTNLANSNLDVAGRIAAMPALNSKIMAAVQGNGGDREAGLEVYQKILGAGPFSKEQADVMAPMVMRGATASGAGAGEIADIGIAAVQNMGFKDRDLARIIGMSIKSGDLGGFELGKMAQFLPGQMGMASETLGMKGDRGLAQLLTFNQAAMLTEKDPNKAANNVANLLAKMTAADTLKDFAKQHIDLTKEMQRATERGSNPIAAFMRSVDRVMSGSKEYQALNKKLATTADDSEKNRILEQQRALIQGAGLGSVLQDMQARMAYFGLKKMGAAEFERQVAAVQLNPEKTLETSFGVKRSTLAFSSQQRRNAELNAETEALTKLNPALKGFNDWITKFAEEHPGLATAIKGSLVGLTTLGAAAGASAFVMTLLTRNATMAASALGTVGGAGGTGGAGGAPRGTALGKVGKVVSLVGAAAAGYEIGTQIVNPVINLIANKLGGDKGDTLGTLIWSWTHQEQEAKLNAPTPLHRRSFSEDTALRRQMAGPPSATPSMVDRAIASTLQPQPIDARLKVDIAFDGHGQPYVKQKSIGGTGIRLDTGPMMAY